ncbi:MAG: glycosyltransferase family 2 protein [Thermoguttaceae bacterium]|jgi:glycosyltransferase involved in cell wall biosynthesis|nr:glycosyltransferase family 2 protein [Thermoguttaceae bacterium]
MPDSQKHDTSAWYDDSAEVRIARQMGLAPLPAELRLSVVVPVYNEEATVEEVIHRIRQHACNIQIVAVDDASTDGTSEVLARLAEQADGGNLTVIRHERNRGKGGALRTGFGHVTGEVVLIQDADLEYDPAEYPRLVWPILEGKADVVYGSRFSTTAPHRVLYYWHSVANRTLTMLSNLTTDLNLTDMETCYKVFRREVIDAILPTLKENAFGIEPELTAKIARRAYRVYEVGIGYSGRTYAAGKKIGLKDALRAVWCILRYWRCD